MAEPRERLQALIQTYYRAPRLAVDGMAGFC